MRIYAFTSFYPSLYKPYYDVHFADLLAQGHDLTILASGMLGNSISERARRSGLVERTRYFIPDELRQIAWSAPRLTANLLRGGRGALDAAITAGSEVAGLRNRFKAAARALLLPRNPPDLCIVHSHETLGLLPWLHRIYPGVPIVLYYYGGIPPEAGGRGMNEAIGPHLRGIGTIFTCSGYARRELIRRGADSERVRVLPLAFDLDDFSPSDSRGYRADGTLRLLSVGRLSRGKGHEDALEALRLVCADPDIDLEYTIVGGGVLRQELEEVVRDKGLEGRVTFTGPLDNRLVRGLYERSDVLLLSSYSTPTWAETQGTVIQEAMLMKALVVTTRTGGVPESIPNWMRSFQVPERRPSALADAIRRIAGLTIEDMAQLGEMNRRWVLERFDISSFNRVLLSSRADSKEDRDCR